MADQTPIAAWLFERRQKFQLNITEFRWGKSLPEPIFDMEVSIYLNNKTSLGRGTSRNELIALEKACAEAIERLVCQHHGQTTEGFALHPVQMAATENARLEALERFLFTWHREKRVPFDFGNNQFTGDFETELKSYSPEAKIEFRFMKSPRSLFAPVCKITHGDHSFMGLSCGSEMKNTFEKAYFEAFRNFVAQKLNPESYYLALKNNPDLWCGDSGFIQKLDPLFISQVSNEPSPLFDMTSEHTLIKSIPGLEDCPFYLERATVTRGTHELA